MASPGVAITEPNPGEFQVVITEPRRVLQRRMVRKQRKQSSILAQLDVAADEGTDPSALQAELATVKTDIKHYQVGMTLAST